MALGFAGCKKTFLSELAVNPNAPSQATPQLVMTSVLHYTAGDISGGGLYQNIAVWMGYWNYSGNYSIGTTTLNYTLTSGTPQAWDQWYGNLSNINYIEQSSKVLPGYDNFVAIAKILKALNFQYLVDFYDKVPYSQAFQGVGNFFPKYDDGLSVYTSLIGQLDSAITIINNAPAGDVNPQASDVMFGGNMQEWAQFANTLKLRFLLREAMMSGQTSFIQGEIAKTLATGFLGQGQDALVQEGYNNSSQGNQTPVWANYGESPSGSLYADSYNFMRAGGYAMSFYKSTNDPRLGYFYGKIGDDPTDPAFSTPDPLQADFVATMFGDPNVIPNSGASGIGPGVMQGPAAPAPVMLASEALFLQAEAALMGWIPGSAQTLYQEAITESFRWLGDANYTTDAQTYYSQVGVAGVSWPATQAGQDTVILTQKWAALNGNDIVESYDDYREFGIPNVPLSLNSTVNVSHLPWRYLYPQREFDTNGKNANQYAGINDQTDKIFWMP